MHHGRDNQSSEIVRAIQEMAKKKELGPTGDYPDGKLTEHDEGGIKIGVTVKDGKVILAFGGSVTWIGLDAKQARQLAESLRKASYGV